MLDEGRRAASGGLRLWVLPNGRDHPRFGVLVTRRQGNAVRRNRLRRLLREAFRLTQAELPKGVDIIAAPTPSAELTLASCMAALSDGVRRGAGGFRGPTEASEAEARGGSRSRPRGRADGR